MTDLPNVLALNPQGFEYERPSRVVGELPHKLRRPALWFLAKTLGVKLIKFGVPVHITLGMTKRQARKHTCDWLLNSGDNMPLSLLKEDDKELLARMVGYETCELTFDRKLREAKTGREICPFSLAPFDCETRGDQTLIRTYAPSTNNITSTAIGFKNNG